MFVETSAVGAILADEPEAGTLLAQLENARTREAGAHVRLEATIDLARPRP
jgi:ribonuclease VapC